MAHDGGVRSIAVQPPGKPPSFEISCPESVYHFATGGEDFMAKIWKVQCDQNSQARGRLYVAVLAVVLIQCVPNRVSSHTEVVQVLYDTCI